MSDAYAFDLVRGLLDGDGSVITYFYDVPGGSRPCEVLSTIFCSASRAPLDWLRELLARLVGVTGSVSTKQPSSERQHQVHKLKYSKASSCLLLPRVYADSEQMRLDRKRVWNDFLARRLPAH